MLAEVCSGFWSWSLVEILSWGLVEILKLKFGRNFEAEVWSRFCSWSLVDILRLEVWSKCWIWSLFTILNLKFGQDFKACWSFYFEYGCWMSQSTALGPLCLCQCYIMQPRREVCSPYDDVDCLLLPRKNHWFSEFSKSTSHESCLLRFHCISRYPGLSSTRFAETQLAKMRTSKWLWWLDTCKYKYKYNQHRNRLDVTMIIKYFQVHHRIGLMSKNMIK